ncbi:hypothetical protein ACHAXS_011334 [Conticribra weissflogii]
MFSSFWRRVTFGTINMSDVKIEELWRILPSEKDEAVYSVSFKPNGTNLAACKGRNLYLYDSSNGRLLRKLRGHTATIYTIAWSADGSQLASGGSDNTTIIWDGNSLKGVLKFSHDTSVQAVAFHPTSNILASCSNMDFGLWSSTTRKVSKFKVESKILAAAWSGNGDHLALAHESGQVGLWDVHGNGMTILGKSDAPIWCLAWIPNHVIADNNIVTDILVVGSWKKSISFLDEYGRETKRNKNTDQLPCSLSYSGETHGSFMIISGSGGRSSIINRDGNKIAELPKQDSWIWRSCLSPLGNRVAIGMDSGSIAMYSVSCPFIWGTDGCWMAWRNGTMDVILNNGARFGRIRCHSEVCQISICGNCLAVKLLDKVIIYELVMDDNAGISSECIHSFATKRVNDCFHLLTNQLIVSKDDTLFLISFDGKMLIECALKSRINCISAGVITKNGRVSITVGLENGDVLNLLVKPAFPLDFELQHRCGINEIIQSPNQSIFAVIDADHTLYLYHGSTKQLILSEKDIDGFVFHSSIPNFICFSRRGSLVIQTLDGCSTSFQLKGKPVVFNGSGVLLSSRNSVIRKCLSMVSILKQMLAHGDVCSAKLIVSTLGVDEAWSILAEEVKSILVEKDLPESRDFHTVACSSRVQKQIQKQDIEVDKCFVKSKLFFKIAIFIMLSQYESAVRFCLESKLPNLAIEILIQLERWNQAKELARQTNCVQLDTINRRQASSAAKKHDIAIAKTLYLESGGYTEAIQLIGANKCGKWEEEILDVLEMMPSKNNLAIVAATSIFEESEVDDQLLEKLYSITGNSTKLLLLYYSKDNFFEARRIFDCYQDKIDSSGIIAYAKMLVSKGDNLGAFEIYCRHGIYELGFRNMKDLLTTAVTMDAFDDARTILHQWYTVASSYSTNDIFNESKESPLKTYNTRAIEFQAEIYYMYHFIHLYCTEPFTSSHPETILNISSLLHNSISPPHVPQGISMANILYALTKNATLLDANGTAKFAFEKLRDRYIMPQHRSNLGVEFLDIYTKSFDDNPDILPTCYKCGSTNPLIRPTDVNSSANTVGWSDQCISCNHPFIRCFVNFDVLPLIEFTPPKEVSHSEAIELILKTRQDKECCFSLDSARNEENENGLSNELFDSCVLRSLNDKSLLDEDTSHKPVEVDYDSLISLPRQEIFVIQESKRQISKNAEDSLSGDSAKESGEERCRFFKNVLPEIGIALCPNCHNFFHESDFEFEVLRTGGCPFCKFSDFEHHSYGHI